MAIHFVCPACLTRLKFRDSEAGQKRRCRRCQVELTVPGEAVVMPGHGAAKVHMIEMVIAVVLVVGALVGVWYYFSKWRPEHNTVQQTRRTSVRETAPVPTKNVSPTGVKPVQPPLEALKAGQVLALGPGKVKVAGVKVVVETAVDKRRAAPGKKFLLVEVEVSSVSAEPSLDTLGLALVGGDRSVDRVVSVSTQDQQGNLYEVARKQVSAQDTAGKPVSLGLYFEVPKDLDVAKCRLAYQ